jgi:hypothetical protein
MRTCNAVRRPTCSIGAPALLKYPCSIASLAQVREALDARQCVTTAAKAFLPQDRAANLRLFPLVREVLHAIEAGAFHPVVGWHCQVCSYQPRCWAWG